MTFSQKEYTIRCEWGLRGAQLLAQSCNAIIIVDVLSFSTAVTIAVSNGSSVYPYRYRGERRLEFATQHNAILAGPRKSGGYSLSPSSLLNTQSDQKIVLPSPNGATISLATGSVPTYARCLRNVNAVADAAQRHGSSIGIIPCGERWREDGSLRPAIEDYLGAGAIIHALSGDKSIESQLAEKGFLSARDTIHKTISACSSGQELHELGFDQDVLLAAQLNTADVAPRLVDQLYYS